MATLTGDNGLLQKATTAKEENEKAKELELIKLAVSAAQTKGEGIIDTYNLTNELESNFNMDNINLDEKSGGWFFKKNNEYTIYNNGKVQEGNLLLPKGYQKVQYIETSGKQWIDTKIGIDFGYSFNIDCKIKNNNLMWNAIVGASNDSKNKFRFALYPQSTLVIAYINGKSYTASCKDIYLRDSAIINFKNGKSTFNYNNTMLNVNEDDFGEDVNGNFSLMCDNSNRDFFKGYIFSVMIYDENKCIRNYIPCNTTMIVTDVDGKERSAGTVGLYDTVNGQFYVNKGTGTFGYEMEDGTYVAPQ